MHNGSRSMMNTRPPRPPNGFAGRQMRRTSGPTPPAPTHPRPPRPPNGFAGRQMRRTSGPTRQAPSNSHDARRNYERYIALAQAQAQSGDIVAAENYYQHAEHYFRA